jgi:predicted ATPase
MINELLFENFKLFGKTTRFSGLRNVNLLTGVNGRGKSSALQSLLLFKQTLLRSRSSRQVFLSGSFVDLGNAADVKHVDASVTKPIRIGFRVDKTSYIYTLGISGENNQALDIKRFESSGNLQMSIDIDDNTIFHDLVPETGKNDKLVLPFQDVIYISAERIGPKMSFSPSSDDWIDKRGEHTIQMLYERQYDKVDDSIIEGMNDIFYDIDEDELSPAVNDVLNFWMTKMFGSSSATVSYIEAANIYALGISTEQKGGKAVFKPTNVGFGYTYALPILIAGLTAPKGSILIVENPEAHLHPSAQSMITKFLGLVANCGVQVFIETHSEHILNALRVMVVQKNMEAQDINVMYFDRELENFFESIAIEDNGKLDHWPANFFDQAEKDLNVLLGI